MSESISRADTDDLAQSQHDHADERTGKQRNRLVLLLGVIAALSLALDLITKAWAWHALRDGQIVRIIPRFLHFDFGFNTGAAFGLLREHDWARGLFIVVTMVALAYIVQLARTLPTTSPWGFVALGFIVGGTLGNLLDRLFRTMDVGGRTLHGVVDFIVVFYWPGHRWPAFNVADAALVVGVVVFLLYLRKHGDPVHVAPALHGPPA